MFSALGAELPKGSLLYFVLPQLEPQSDAPRLADAELFLVDLVSQFLQLDLLVILVFTSFCFWYAPIAARLFRRDRKPRIRNPSLFSVMFLSEKVNNKSNGKHTIVMKNKNDGNPTDKMIQANKDEADSMLSLWGMKKRKRIRTKKVGR